jgi:hypothetical protein
VAPAAPRSRRRSRVLRHQHHADPDTGIGRWSDAEIIAAIRAGYARDKGVEAGDAHYQYAGMADGDVADLVAYLRTLPPVRRANRDAEVSLPFPASHFAPGACSRRA